jgi:uncharacterized membrane protein
MNQGATNFRTDRLLPLDALRGLILVLMAVDHANYFVARLHPTGEFWGIPLPRYDSLLAFITRAITHPCAPGFFFLMGTGMVLFAQSRLRLGWPQSRVTRFFLKRGILLMLLQFFMENSCWLMGPEESLKPPGGDDRIWLHFGVLFALGAAMILGAALVRLKWGFVLGLSCSALIFTWLLIPDPSQAGRLFSPWTRILLIPGRTGMVQVFYSVLPWAGVAGLGVVFGRLLSPDAKKAYGRAGLAGLFFILLFPVLRLTGGLGSFHPYRGGGGMAFFNVTKYPPSLTFLLLTLGFCLLMIWLLSRIGGGLARWGKPLIVFGRAALFFYLLHLYIFGLVGLFAASLVKGSLIFMYGIWLAVLFVLYPLCLWYGRFKAGTRPDSVWRLF